jgi:hypothetical protein
MNCLHRIGLTGGLAAPLIAPLLVTISGGALAFLGTAGGTILLGTLFGLGGGGRKLAAFRATKLSSSEVAAKRVNRRVKGIEVRSAALSSAQLTLRLQQFEFAELQDPDLPIIPSLHVCFP